jgi:hypothetical protein
MLIIPASSLWLGMPDAVGSTAAFSEPFSLGGADRASAILTVEGIYGGLGVPDRSIAYSTQTSLDGVNRATQGPADSTTDMTGATPRTLNSDGGRA